MIMLLMVTVVVREDGVDYGGGGGDGGHGDEGSG